MEYCSGGDLYHKITEAGFENNDEMFSIAKQLFLGVDYIHSVGVAHRYSPFYIGILNLKT